MYAVMYLIAKLVSSSWKLAMASNALLLFDALSVIKDDFAERLLANLLILFGNSDPCMRPLKCLKRQ